MNNDLCKRNHPLSGPGADVRVYKGRDGYKQRVCRACERIRQAELRKTIRTNYLKVRKQSRRERKST